MGPARAGRHLHVDDRQPAVRLDALRESHPRPPRVGTPVDPARVHRVRRDRDVARAARRVHRRSDRPTVRRRDRRTARRNRVGDQRRCELARNALRGRGSRRGRRRRCLRRMRRQCAQVVPRPARARRGAHGNGIRRGVRAHRVPDRQHDQVAGLRGDVLQVRSGTRRGGVRGQLVPPRAQCVVHRGQVGAEARCSVPGPQLHAESRCSARRPFG